MALTDRVDPAFGRVRSRARRELFYRHALAVRITHWVNVLCLSLLLMSGLQIFNAHPRLYWGQYGADADRPFIALEAEGDGDDLAGVTRIGPLQFDTTGWLGASGPEDDIEARGFPSWATIPSYRDLSAGRRWHFFFAWLFVLNGLVYLGYGLVSGHLRRDLLPDAEQRRPSHILHDIGQHLRLRFPEGDAAKRYNALQKLAYLGVACVLLPLMVLTGLTMSPGIDAVFPFQLDVFGGRQSARTIHFLSAALIVAFVIVHLVMVVLSGPWNNLRSMITGRYAIKHREPPA